MDRMKKRPAPPDATEESLWPGSSQAALEMMLSRIPGAHMKRGELRSPCPVHGGSNPTSLAIKVAGPHRLTARCWSSRCHENYRDFAGALESITQVRLSAPSHSGPHPLPQRPPAPSPTRMPTGGTGRNPAIELWKRTLPLQRGEDHAGRRWLASRNLWRPAFPLPAGVRWLPASAHFKPDRHQGTGSIVAMAAPPMHWVIAWPDTPRPAGVQLISVAYDGTPCLDRPEIETGVGKRSYGRLNGSVLLIGNPLQDGAIEAARVVEGVADGLAVASRHLGPVLVSMGTSGLTHPETVKWLANWPGGVVVHADDDAAGTRAALNIVRLINLQSGFEHCTAFHPTSGKDAADAARLEGFNELQDEWPGYAGQLVELEGLPRPEAARRASIIMQETPLA